MKVVSVNVAEPQEILWQGKKISTGIFKRPVSNNKIALQQLGVEGDYIADRRYHGGTEMACYLFSASHYEYWRGLYPDLDWHYGIFGENITIDEFSESEICIGDKLEIGDVVLEVCQPRMPCFKLGARFGSSKLVKQFAKYHSPGIYVRVINAGIVSKESDVKWIKREGARISILDIYKLRLEGGDKAAVEEALTLNELGSDCVKALKKLYETLK